jgi:hypothetical protein
MKIIKHLISALFFVLGIQFGNSQNISVDEGYSPQTLVEDILINSSCANVFNVSVSGGFCNRKKTIESSYCTV